LGGDSVIGIHGLLLYFAIRLVLLKATTLEEARGTRSGVP
jgi:hypothetical protein